MSLPPGIAADVTGALQRSMARPRPLSRLAQLLGLSILRGDIAPGAAVSLEALPTCDLNASRTQFREAVKVLEGKGLIESRPRSGTRVRPRELWNLCDPDVISWRIVTGEVGDVLTDLHQLRCGMEPQAATLAARTGSEAEHAETANAFSSLDRTLGGEDMQEAVDAAFAAHHAVLRASGNRMFASLGTALEPAYVVSLNLVLAKHPDRPRLATLYRGLGGAIAAGAAGDAREAAVAILVETERATGNGVADRQAGMAASGGDSASVALAKTEDLAFRGHDAGREKVV